MGSLSSMDAARLAVQALLDGGVRQVVLAPGSRSAPLSYALAEAEGAGLLELVVRVDERVAGFTALGLALGSGAPAAAVTTSGTAVGNLLPAVMEANHAAVPLLIVSADRPEELRGTGANQTTFQLDLFGEHVRFAVDVPAGTDPSGAIGTALSAAQGRLPGTPAGPVQLNLAFRDPLTPALDGSGWAEPDGGIPEGTDALLEGTDVLLDRTDDVLDGMERQLRDMPSWPDGAAADGAGTGAGKLTPGLQPSGSSSSGVGLRTVVVAGHAAGPSAEEFARALDLPLLAEPSSNARFGPNAVGPYRLLLEHLGPDIERVVVFGRPTLSRPVAALLARADVKRALYLPRPAAWFVQGRRSEQIITGWSELADFAGYGPSGWLNRWQVAAAASETVLEELLAGEPELTGVQVARLVWEHRAAPLMLGSSNPIRDVDLAGRPQQDAGAPVYANRGLAGIDGTLATAAGIALANGTPVRALLGDLTFLHDVGALLLGTGERVPDLQLIVLNDGGGGIFSLLEHGTLGRSPRYAAVVERLFGTPHAADLAALAGGYGVRHRLISTTEELATALAEPVAGRSILEIRSSREGLQRLHARLRGAIAAALTAAVEPPHGS
ncbi:2-succinyl-5-enolpyruvyl-6-hydroxy-3-cyclohexene-1-carboxylic-acid synthase [Paenarthrobacter sp. Z7-10]|nr:2-succinyl-5-enolpyruvyl-6-hydroxy-3-cyclohexene-1-carboxylic-acid synthase [Paenarthrobacter sp. Z7-10]MCZ2402305.1 2-succinyl-5-enolpyruvyl-6-hydroxy-3-cyclohexene-1-carboxylic-acid synthase [Paenarthrobacter sp. Z7-10]